MCGLFAYLGKEEVLPFLLDGLKKLEYRGYDSAGVAVISGRRLLVEKAVGKISDLENSLSLSDFSGHIGIAHTRWATHGRVNLSNSHPFIDCQKQLAVVHNGIIENFRALKKNLQKKGHKFSSETDSEVIAHLIEEYQKKYSFEEAVRLSLLELEGSYALLVVSLKEQDKIVVVRHNSPLVIGFGEEGFFVSSDLPALAGKVEKILNLSDGELAVISKTGVIVKDFEGRVISKLPERFYLKGVQIGKAGYRHFMLKEIHEQPGVIHQMFKERIDPQTNQIRFPELRLAPEELKKIQRIVLTACGTSWHAALVAEYWLEQYLRIPVEVEYAAEFRYRYPVVDQNTLIIAISQSGETADTLAAVREARTGGAKVLSIVNVEGGSLSLESDGVIYTRAGAEIGVASTKAFISQLGILFLFTLYLAWLKKGIGVRQWQRKIFEFCQLPQKMETILSHERQIYLIGEKIFRANNTLYLGRGKGFPIALEGALKLKEVSYIHAEGYPAAEMKHGPIALIDHNMPVVVLAFADRRYEKILNNIEEVRARGGYLIAVATEGDAQILEKVSEVIYIPETSEDLAPFLGVIPLQLLAYYIALRRSCDVDQPRHLAKSVTVE
jgi:glucosamine--fructose-6-phosphate aminotransferase (isomerizing)